MTSPSTDKPRLPAKKLMTRRGFMKTMGGSLLAGAGTYAYGSTVEVHRLVTEHVTVSMPGLASRWHSRKIVQLSDLHAGRTSLAFIRQALETAEALKPEAIVITGDFVDSDKVDPAPLCDILQPFARKMDIIGITGNHDFSPNFVTLKYVEHVCDSLRAAGVRMLRNDIYQPSAGTGEICFAGMEDYWSGLLQASTLHRVPTDASVIALSHNPDSYELLEPYRFDLMLSGHTHGGQVCLPWIGPLILPVKHRERAAGLFHLSPKNPERALYVSRGVGHLLGVRLFCPPEVTCLTLRNPAMA